METMQEMAKIIWRMFLLSRRFRKKTSSLALYDEINVCEF